MDIKSIDTVRVRTHKGRVELDLKPVKSLPFVSVVTITKDRDIFFSLPIHNWTKFKYPEDLIEWVIVDDSKTDQLRDQLPTDPRIKYFHRYPPLPIPDKRNFAVKKCKGEVIVHMDDDDVYFPDSILAKARILNDRKDKDCIVSSPVGLYDLFLNKSVIADSKSNDIAEATFTYRKSFWKKQKFAPHPKTGSEWYGLLHGRLDQVINLPFWFNCVMINHRNNTTGSLRSLKHVPCSSSKSNFHHVWGQEVSDLIQNIKSKLKIRQLQETKKNRNGK